MATIQEHNNIIKVSFDGSKHLKHVLTSDKIAQMSVIENRWPLTKYPVCSHCEKLAMWDKDSITGVTIATCPACGGHTYNPISYSTYLANGYDIDPNGKTFTGINTYTDEKRKREYILPDFGF